jgi:predicted small lipoprotein YifL
MKNLFKTCFLAFTVAVAITACKGNNTTHVPDSTRVDSSKNSSVADSTIGKNGSPNAIDTGIDKSGSGGTDTVKKDNK